MSRKYSYYFNLIILAVFLFGCEKGSTEPETDEISPVLEYSVDWFTTIPLNTLTEIIVIAYDETEINCVEINWYLYDANNNLIESHAHSNMTAIDNNQYKYTLPGYNIQRDILYQIIAWDTSMNFAVSPYLGWYTIHIR
jgi:hypothetical protein